MNNQETYYRAAIGAFIVNTQNQLLIVHKHDHEGKWDIPKGGINQGESELEALKRELKEELGLDEYEILKKSKISLVKFIPHTDERSNILGQAYNVYWLRVSSNVDFEVPNQEIEQVKWINIEPDTIKNNLKIHDEGGVLQTLLPQEFKNKFID